MLLNVVLPLGLKEVFLLLLLLLSCVLELKKEMKEKSNKNKMKYLLEPNIFILLVFRTARRCIRQTRKSFVMSLRVLKMPYVHLSLYACGVRSKTHLERKTHVFRSRLWNDTVLSSNLCLWRISSWHAIQCAVNAVWMAVLLWGMMMRKFPHMPHIDVIIWGVINIF